MIATITTEFSTSTSTPPPPPKLIECASASVCARVVLCLSVSSVLCSLVFWRYMIYIAHTLRPEVAGSPKSDMKSAVPGTAAFALYVHEFKI
jgi:hypothetical protein